jgi:hypothetical protein
MTTVGITKSRGNRAVWILSVKVTLMMGVLYTWLDIIQLPEPINTILAFIPGSVSVLLLIIAGMKRAKLYLAPAWISKPGFGALAATTILLLPILSSSTTWLGWQWLPALVYAPASGVAQELYFRSALLPALERAVGNKKVLALTLHAILFTAYHFRTFQAIPTLPIAGVVFLVLFLAGCGWGWQVQRDRTVVWAMLQHSTFLVLMSMFEWR